MFNFISQEFKELDLQHVRADDLEKILHRPAVQQRIVNFARTTPTETEEGKDQKSFFKALTTIIQDGENWRKAINLDLRKGKTLQVARLLQAKYHEWCGYKDEARRCYQAIKQDAAYLKSKTSSVWVFDNKIFWIMLSLICIFLLGAVLYGTSAKALMNGTPLASNNIFFLFTSTFCLTVSGIVYGRQVFEYIKTVINQTEIEKLNRQILDDIYSLADERLKKVANTVTIQRGHSVQQTQLQSIRKKVQATPRVKPLATNSAKSKVSVPDANESPEDEKEEVAVPAKSKNKSKGKGGKNKARARAAEPVSDVKPKKPQQVPATRAEAGVAAAQPASPALQHAVASSSAAPKKKEAEKDDTAKEAALRQQIKKELEEKMQQEMAAFQEKMEKDMQQAVGAVTPAVDAKSEVAAATKQLRKEFEEEQRKQKAEMEQKMAEMAEEAKGAKDAVIGLQQKLAEAEKARAAVTPKVSSNSRNGGDRGREQKFGNNRFNRGAHQQGRFFGNSHQPQPQYLYHSYPASYLPSLPQLTPSSGEIPGYNYLYPATPMEVMGFPFQPQNDGAPFNPNTGQALLYNAQTGGWEARANPMTPAAITGASMATSVMFPTSEPVTTTASPIVAASSNPTGRQSPQARV